MRNGRAGRNGFGRSGEGGRRGPRRPLPLFLSESPMNVRSVPVELFDPDPDQPRRSMAPAAVSSLAGSLRQVGQLQPVVAVERGGRFVLVDGHRRHAAATEAGLESLEAAVWPDRPGPAEVLEMQLAANCQREGLSPLERADAYVRMKADLGLNSTELAARLCVSKSTVTQTLSYAELPPEAKELLAKGKLSGSAAYAIARATPEIQRELIRKAQGGRLTRAAAGRPAGPSRRRTTLALPDAEVTVAVDVELDAEACATVLRRAARECRAAAKRSIDLPALERVLASQNRGH